MTSFASMPIRVSEHAVTTRVEFTVVRNLRRRRKRWSVKRDEYRDPCAYVVNSGALSLTGQLGGEVLVVHPSIYEAMKVTAS